MFEVLTYQDDAGHQPYMDWLSKLPDKQAKARVLVRVMRMAGQGVWELRIDWGPGYRVYYAQAGKKLVLLLTGGDKRKQQADIAAAVEYWNNWQRSNAK
jgi:putative addiction module killer protein